MHEEFKQAFDREELDQMSKRRMKNNLSKLYGQSSKGVYHSFKRNVAMVASVIGVVILSGGTVMAMVPEARNAIVSGVKGFFGTRKEAAKEVYGENTVDDYLHILDEVKEESTFNKDEIEFRMVSYIGDKKGMQILIEYSVNDSFYHSFPSFNEIRIEGEKEVFFAGERWINKENNTGYSLLNVAGADCGTYTLCINDLLWGSSYFEGEYKATFTIDEKQEFISKKIDKEYELKADADVRNVKIEDVEFTPVSSSIRMELKDGFDVNKVFDLVLNPHQDPENPDFYFIGEDGKRIDVDTMATFSEMWETNGEFSADGCALASEGAHTTLFIVAKEPIDMEKVIGIYLVGNVIDLK